MLKPARDCILVELQSEYEHIETPIKKYDTTTKGICRGKGSNIEDDLVDKVVFFESYKDDAVITLEGKKYAFIKGEYILGMEE